MTGHAYPVKGQYLYAASIFETVLLTGQGDQVRINLVRRLILICLSARQPLQIN